MKDKIDIKLIRYGADKKNDRDKLKLGGVTTVIL